MVCPVKISLQLLLRPRSVNYMKTSTLRLCCTLGILLTILCRTVTAGQPNIVWFVVDDMSANFSCYGEKIIQTPNVDQLAKEGVRFTKAYATSPVCSTFRSALITGMYQTTIGSHHHRSGRGEHRIKLPQGVKPIPSLFQDAGYYTCIGSGLPDYDYRFAPTNTQSRTRVGKTDYNFDWDKTIYDSHDWSGRDEGQPFFMQVQLHGGKLRGASEEQYKKIDQQALKIFGAFTNPNVVELPPYYPRDSVLLKDWSTYLDSVRITDHHVGLVTNRLREENLLDNTVIVFFTDHGISHARGKQFLYDEGTHIPLIVSGPGFENDVIRKDLVEHIDVAAFSLAAAGIPIPESMQGQDIFASDYQMKSSIYAARDRCGEAADRIRSVRSEQYLYIRNFYPERPHLMPSTYKDSKLILRRLRELHQQSELSTIAENMLFAPTRPAEELYLYNQDRWQVENLAQNPDHAYELSRHREHLNRWITRTADLGPETMEVYELEVEDQIRSTKNQVMRETYRKNVELYKQWQREGK